jgi:hypothetical protein
MAINIDPAPTTGLTTNVYVQLSGTGLTALNAPSVNHPNAGPYSLTLSLSSASGLSNTCTMTPITVDGADTTVTSTAASWVIQSFGYWVGTEASIYTGSLNGANIAPKPTNTGKIASVSGGGTTSLVITAVAVGHCVVEVTYPTFNNTETGKTVSTGIPPANNFVTVPNDSIYAQVIVTVIP